MINETTTSLSGSTDMMAIYLFIAIGVFLLSILIYLMVMFRKRYIRNTVKFNIISKDGSIKFKRIKDVQKTNSVFKSTYIFDHRALVTRTFGREIYYLSGVKEPINFNDIKSIKGISPIELDAVIQEKITEKLLGGSDIGTAEILMIVLIVGVAIMLFMLYGIQSKGVTLNPESIVLIKDAFRSVISGG